MKCLIHGQKARGTKLQEGNFPGGPVAKTLCFQCRGPGFNSWSGNLFPHAATNDPTGCNEDRDPACHNQDAVQPNKQIKINIETRTHTGVRPFDPSSPLLSQGCEPLLGTGGGRPCTQASGALVKGVYAQKQASVSRSGPGLTFSLHSGESSGWRSPFGIFAHGRGVGLVKVYPPPLMPNVPVGTQLTG